MARLSEIFDLQMGKTPARANSDYWDNGTNSWVSIADLSRCEKYVEDTKEQITDKAVQESGIKVVPPDTVIMSFKLSLGKTAITKETVYTNEAIMAFIPNGRYNISPDYFFYMLSGKDWSKGTNRAVMGATLNKATLGEVDVPVPPIEKQQYIASVLDKLSDVISLRKQQLAKLDELVKARFVEMFGDPIHNDYKLPQVPMTDLCEIIDGDRGENYPKQEEFFEQGYCLFLNAKNVTNTGFSYNTCMFITQEKDECLRKGKLNRGDIVLTTRGTIGNLAFYDGTVPFENVRINSGMVILRIKSEMLSELFFMEQFKILLPSIKERIASGSAQPQLPISTMNKILMVLPEIDKQRNFSDFVGKVARQKLTIQQSLDKLEVLRKSLMQEYFG